MDLGLTGRVAIVAASSRGLGKAIASELAHEGCKVMLCARGAEALEAARAELEEAGLDVRAKTADVSRRPELDALVDATLEAWGRVDILVTNGGGPPPGKFEETGREEWDYAVKVTLDSVVHLVRRVLPGMRNRGWGRIVNVTSIAVKQPVDGLMLSNSLRAAVTGFARTLANEVAADGVTVNNVMPGFTWTDRVDELADKTAAAGGITRDQVVARWEDEIPAARLGEPKELAALTAFLCSTRAAYITGQSIPVDGGWIRSLL